MHHKTNMAQYHPHPMSEEQPTGKVEVIVRIRPLGPTDTEDAIF